MKPLHWIISLLWLAAIIGVESISRSSFFSLWGLFSIAFAGYAWLVFNKQSIPLFYGILIAVICRLAGFFFDPMLSDDYYRYIWDGMLMHQGINPMAYIPSYLMLHPELAIVNAHLFDLLNSPDYYSVYPPVMQWMNYISFGINHLNTGGHILFYKILLFIVDLSIFYLLGKLLTKNNLNANRLLIYALNPLVIIEYTGNLHFEGLMIAGLFGAILLSDHRHLVWSSLLMALSIATKMLTLILIPFISKDLYWKKFLRWCILAIVLILIFFWITFGSELNWLNSCLLWFQNFEFNASIYYIVRQIGYWIMGYNAIKWVGPLLGVVTLILVGVIWLKYRSKKYFPWSSAMLYVLTSYFLLSTTVHPWYIGTLLALSVLSLHTYPIVWTYLVFLSYSHYSGGGFQENYTFIAAEYILLFAWMIFEIKRSDKRMQDARYQMPDTRL